MMDLLITRLKSQIYIQTDSVKINLTEPDPIVVINPAFVMVATAGLELCQVPPEEG